MSAPLGALISACIVVNISMLDRSSKNTSNSTTCDWCGKFPTDNYWLTYLLCESCGITAAHSLELGRQVTELKEKGGIQLYIAIERTGQRTALVSVKRWSPLESLESADYVGPPFHTYPLPQE